MRYLVLTRCEGVYEYIPLEQVAFGFIQTDDNEYRVEITVGGKHTETLFEKHYFGSPTMHAHMKKIAALEDGTIIPPEALFYD